MARGVDFPEANVTLVGSPEDRSAGTVYDLRIHRYRDLDGNPHVISRWRLSPEELLEVRKTGVIWLHSWGETHPPISVDGLDPFRKEKNGKDNSEATDII